MEDDWRAEVRLGLEALIDKAVVTGAIQVEVFAVVKDELARLRAAMERDPDPSEDDIKTAEEPANDWPGAS
ncbi:MULTISPECIES: hypothetical protein [unclassified Rhizobium]|uniref:hypothetical protein n=1 Tax=unclassified Rhizobium TaxID=2613769 RepID=UPI0006F23892|nr:MULTISPECIES: hypothetical protein [unclassified Rhizobium]KQV40546.1 hypothetical protein ASC86_21765 [Rhizobium sp. Root1212]KRD35591.1 hypothetical protein ASE37_21055 [Rhizobium sp. Root268]